MLKALELENFKSFGTRARIPMAPITLILGQNSAGKSSILQALTLLKQTHASRDGGAALLPRSADCITDLGSFSELLFDHESSRTLHLGIEVAGQLDGYGPTRALVRGLGLQSTLLDLAFTREPNDSETRLSGFDLLDGGGGQVLARFETATNPDADHELLRHRFPDRSIADASLFGRPHPLGVSRCTAVSEWRELWAIIHKSWSQHREEISRILNDPEEVQRRGRFWARGSWLHDTDRQPPRSSLDEAKRFYASDFTPEELRLRMSEWCKETIVALDGFMPRSAELSDLHLLPELSLMYQEIQKGRLLVLDLGWFVNSVASPLETVLRQLFPLGPWRRPPERHYIFSGTSSQHVGYSGADFPVLLYRRPELVKQANGWLERLEVGHELKVRPLGHQDSDVFELRLVDKRRASHVDVALADVGFGVTQILPFVIQCLVDSNRLISIEQPEIHIHPKLQAELGELIAWCISEPHHHRFLIETHSEHLVLRFQKLIRNGVLKPEDVSIAFVSRTEDGSTVKRLRLDEEGDFVDEWPGGFFPERLRELRELR